VSYYQKTWLGRKEGKRGDNQGEMADSTGLQRLFRGKGDEGPLVKKKEKGRSMGHVIRFEKKREQEVYARQSDLFVPRAKEGEGEQRTTLIFVCERRRRKKTTGR